MTHQRNIEHLKPLATQFVRDKDFKQFQQLSTILYLYRVRLYNCGGESDDILSEVFEFLFPCKAVSPSASYYLQILKFVNENYTYEDCDNSEANDFYDLVIAELNESATYAFPSTFDVESE